ncbi:hypothetical protein WJX75_003176 [Coccomyxa subellipsoidea]|uniref:Kazal-like domain-containing protein n=1 Tax=Coccomyxa subellipsoidea TaxID=248742 RepID=A0ABR2Z0X4_9CHLO
MHIDGKGCPAAVGRALRAPSTGESPAARGYSSSRPSAVKPATPLCRSNNHYGDIRTGQAEMTASRSHALFALWAVVMLAATMQASGIRNLLQPPQFNCSTPYELELASHCPHDGQTYQVCEAGC